MTFDFSKYKTHAAKAYNGLQTFCKSNNGWQVGCVFDTITDYLRMMHDKGWDISGPSPAEMESTVWQKWNDPDLQKTMCWYDDYCWWAIACVKAFDPAYSFFFSNHAKGFKDATKQCWQLINAGEESGPIASHGTCANIRGASKVWENREKGIEDYFNTPSSHWAKPRIEGGVWQYELYHTMRGAKGDCSQHASIDPANPTLPGNRLGPYQLTVMNGLYLVLTVRLHNAAAADGDLTIDIAMSTPDGYPAPGEAASSEYQFLTEWFTLDVEESQALKENNRLLNTYATDKALVRERVSTYAACQPAMQTACPQVQGYYPDVAWGGDQGLVLGGLVDFANSDLAQGEQAAALDVARKIVLGVNDRMTEDNVVQPVLNWKVGDFGDYCSGQGVFFRYLLHSHESVKSQIDPAIVYASAEAACNGSAPFKSGNKLFDHFNVLATLTAAIQLIPDDWTPPT